VSRRCELALADILGLDATAAADFTATGRVIFLVDGLPDFPLVRLLASDQLLALTPQGL
jgi:hypothetical protein